MERANNGMRRWRTVAVLAVGVAIGTTLTATPVYSHVGGSVGHVWKKHIRPQADKRYYKKDQVDAKVAALETRVAALEATLAAVSYDPATKIFRFNGVNVQIVDGTGDTGGEPTGLGNLIVGYNRDSPPLDRGGSHNLVIGDFHTYSGSGGLVAGRANSITGESASVSGGAVNTASGNFASVSGGANNTASGNLASVSGGEHNLASGNLASVSGGDRNRASGLQASISGGSDNQASGLDASVSGGRVNTASGDRSSVSGGRENTASGSQASVSGGSGNTAGAQFASVSGGSSNVAGAIAQWLGGTLNIRTATVAVPGGAEGNGDYATRAVERTCNAGELLLSGGGYWQPVSGVDDNGKELPLIHTRGLDAGNGWSARGGNDTSAERTLVVQALCLGP